MMPTLSHFQALLFDVDNTLTRTDKHLAPATVTAVQQFIQRGYLVGVCTGKSYPILNKKILPHFSPRVLHIVSGGAQIITTEGDVKWQKNIDTQLYSDLKKVLDEHHAHYFVVGEKTLAANTQLIDSLRRHPFEPTVTPLSEFADEAVALLGIYNLTPALIESLEHFHDQITFKIMANHRTGKPYADITAAGVNKAIAFEKWCELSQIQAKEVIGFGDSANDLEFLDLVGFSVAMGNSTDEIKSIAHRVIDHTDDNGLATYLEEVLTTDHL